MTSLEFLAAGRGLSFFLEGDGELCCKCTLAAPASRSEHVVIAERRQDGRPPQSIAPLHHVYLDGEGPQSPLGEREGRNV